jgi:glycerol-3-phosphate acyltransferase PlsY
MTRTVLLAVTAAGRAPATGAAAGGAQAVLPVALYLLAAFLLGSLPFALWIGRAVRGIDVRRHGSGNMGATNVLRLLGPGWGVATLALDVAKGWTAVALAPRWLGVPAVTAGGAWPLAGCVAAVLGHVISPLAGFRGGKGVAAALGGFIALAPVAALVAVAGFVAAVAASRYVSLGSLVMALAFPLAAAWLGPPAPLRWAVVTLGAALALLVAWRHRANWVRIAGGTESRFRWRNRP